MFRTNALVEVGPGMLIREATTGCNPPMPTITQTVQSTAQNMVIAAKVVYRVKESSVSALLEQRQAVVAAEAAVIEAKHVAALASKKHLMRRKVSHTENFDEVIKGGEVLVHERGGIQWNTVQTSTL